MSAAGAGKTWGIVNDALSAISDHDKRILITTYTNKGVDTVKSEIMEQTRGFGSRKILVLSWYQFLQANMIRPYQSFIVGINEIKSIDFENKYVKAKKVKKGYINIALHGDKYRYLNGRQGNHRILSNYASELSVFLNEVSNGKVFRRLEEIYSHIFIDEIQDMAGYDIDIIKLLFGSSIKVCCVGDNKQSTYTTHNARKNKSQSGTNLWEFCADSEQKGLAVVEECMESRRFNKEICDFANRVYPNTKNATTSMNETTGHDGVFIIERSDALRYYDHFKPNVLRFDKREEACGLPAINFGVCKGMTFKRVLIFANGPLTKFLTGTELNSPEKYYVAVTRPKYSLVIAVKKLPTASDTFESVKIHLGNAEIPALRFVSQ